MYRLSVLFSLGMGLAAPAFAQFGGRLTGAVADPSSAAVAGAAVQLYLEDGAAALLATTTTPEGFFRLNDVPPGVYRLQVHAAGFADFTLHRLRIETAQEASVPPIRLELSGVTQALDVTAAPELVKASNAEIAVTYSSDTMRRLPLFRDPGNLYKTLAYATYSSVGNQHYSFQATTIDGIEYHGAGAQHWYVDQVEEATLSATNGNASLSGGSQLAFTTPSGGNQFHGSGYWVDENSAFGAQSWYMNSLGIRNGKYNRTHLGFTVGGPVARDRLFFYGNYESNHWPSVVPQRRIILTNDARNGIFTYQDRGGQLHKVNILQTLGLQPDPHMAGLLQTLPPASNINSYVGGDSLPGLLRNTGAYVFNARNYMNYDNASAKIDYIPSPRHVLSASVVSRGNSRSVTDGQGYDEQSPLALTNRSWTASLAWRWSPGPHFNTELLGGFFRNPWLTNNPATFDQFIVTGMLYSSPLHITRTFGSHSESSHLGAAATYIAGRHAVQFGFQMLPTRDANYSEDGTTPVYSIGLGPGAPGLSEVQLPGIRPQDLSTANQLLATLAGYVSGYSETFNVASPTSGYVAGTPLRRSYAMQNLAYYLQDNWRVSRRLSLNLGLRYDYYGVPNEAHALILQPRVIQNDPVATLRSDATIDFAGGPGAPALYRKDLNNFAPNAGFAWDLSGNGKTALRGGYSIHYVSDLSLSIIGNYLQNFGMTVSSAAAGISARVGEGLPAVAQPPYNLPRLASDYYRINRTSGLSLVDPNLRTPYTQQWTLGIERQIAGAVLEVRYAGIHSAKLLHLLDYNQVILRDNGFLDDFLRARANGNLARAAAQVFSPAYNAQIPGSQPLRIFPQLVNGGALNSAYVRNLIDTGQPAELASYYQTSGLNGTFNFFPNPNALATMLLTNAANSTYNALQVDFRRRGAGGTLYQVSYAFSRTIGDDQGYWPYIDNNDWSYQRMPYGSTHKLVATVAADLPWGPGHRLDFRPLRPLLSHWSAAAIATLQSGPRYSIVSGRATLNRMAYSSFTTPASSFLSVARIDSLFGIRKTGTGAYFIDPSAIGPDGRGVGPDGSPFPGQVFYHPDPGGVGNLPFDLFTGPWTFNADLAVTKAIRIRDRHTLEFRAEAMDALNNLQWQIASPYIDLPGFGSALSTAARTMQMSIQYRF